MITVGPLEVNTWKQSVWTQLTEKNASPHSPQVIPHKVAQKVTSKRAQPFPVGTKVQGALEPGQWCPTPKADTWAQAPPPGPVLRLTLTTQVLGGRALITA